MDKKEELINCDRLFVYGTLQHGQSRHYILQHLKFEKAILPKYRKVSPPSLGFPFIIRDENSHVIGEIYYGLDNKLFQALDLIEGEGSLYHRILVTVKSLKGQEIESFVYYPNKKLINSYL
ncbi:MAG: gamma-glutamylcyclotransferase family protein [Candidatus Hodarchaeota archaeon]